MMVEFLSKEFFDKLYLLKRGVIYDVKKQMFISKSSKSSESLESEKIRMRTKLYDHQKEASIWLQNHEENGNGCILADDMGLGKTLEILSYIISMDITDKKTLIIVPKSILNQWEKEIYTHTTIPKSNVYVYYSRNRTIPKDAWIILTTHQTLVQDKNSKNQTLFTENWHRVIIDESHSIRNTNTKFSSCSLELKKNIGICVSGTPINNYINDLNTQIKFSGIPMPNISLNFNSDDWLGCAIHLFPKTLEEWRKKYILRRTKKDVLSLPPLTINRIQLDFTEKEYLAYEKAINDAQRVFAIWNASFNKTINDYVGVLIQILRMRQACDHMNLFNMSNIHQNDTENCIICGENIIEQNLQNKNICKKHIICNKCITEKPTICHLCQIDPIQSGQNKSTKIDKLIEILKTAKKDKKKTVVFSQWTSMLDIIESRFKDERINFSRLDGSMSASERERQRDSFTEKNDVFLVSLKAGSVGLNLTDAENVVLFDPWWNPFIEWQAFDRVHRIGQTKPVTVFCLEIRYSIEDWMSKLKYRKSECSRIMVGGCEFNSNISSGVNKNDVDDMFTYIRTNMDNMLKHIR